MSGKIHCRFQVLISFPVGIPETGDLLRSEGPGLLDPEYLGVPDERE